MSASDLETAEVGASQLAHILGVSRQRVHQLDQAKILTRVGRGRYRLLASITAYLKFLRSEPRGVDGGGGALDYATERARLTKLQADRAELDLAQARGRLVDIDAVVEPFAEQVSIVRQKFLGLPSKCTPRVVGQDHATTHEILRKEVYGILQELSDYGTAEAEEEAGKVVERENTDA